MKKTFRFTVAAAFAFALLFGVASLFTEAEAARCLCPQIYAPVQCDNGKIYPNSCVAKCHNGKNCVPTGEI